MSEIGPPGSFFSPTEFRHYSGNIDLLSSFRAGFQKRATELVTMARVEGASLRISGHFPPLQVHRTHLPFQALQRVQPGVTHVTYGRVPGFRSQTHAPAVAEPPLPPECSVPGLLEPAGAEGHRRPEPGAALTLSAPGFWSNHLWFLSPRVSTW